MEIVLLRVFTRACIMKYRLGLDLGASSLGWAVMRISGRKKDAEPDQLVACGVRVFEAGVDGDIEQGKDSSRGAVRREARQPRRQNWRRQYRKAKVFGVLQRLKLLPSTADRNAVARDLAVKALDLELSQKWCKQGDSDSYQKLPYLLRAAALNQLLTEKELGRALYHLSQRRGFLPNRKTEKPDDEEAGKVQSGISVLDEARRDPRNPNRLRTLAEFVRDEFHEREGVFELRSERRDSSTRGRIRGRYTSRQMFRDEFVQIRDAQCRLGAKLSDTDWKNIERAMFTQRPMKSQRHLVGRCTLEFDKSGKGRRRCTMAVSSFQEFRLLQTVNHLRVIAPGREPTLSSAERTILIDHLMRKGDLPLKSRRKKGEDQPGPSVMSLLKLPKGAKLSVQTFHDEDDDEADSKLIGHRTNAKLAPIFGELWWSISEADRDLIALQALHLTSPDALAAWATKRWGISSEQAEQLKKVRLEEGYGSLSRRAINKLLPDLRSGLSYSEVRQKVYPESFLPSRELERLPPVNEWNSDIRNPAVIRALSELRKVVNALIEKYKGKPEQIHIELARDLKRSRKDRKEIFKQNEENRKRRDRAKEDILKQLKRSNPSRGDIEKWMLAEECNWQCPYTGKQISPHSLLVESQFDIEHIYPRKYLDDSFANKTLCDHDFNRNRKKDRLPSECMTADELEVVLARVRRFRTDRPDAKLNRFAAESVSADFVTRQLNDTRYNATLAADFLGTLFGGRNDIDGNQRIVTPTGKMTWMLRRGWHLDSILSEFDEKDREDHRAHAVDAICIGLSSQKVINHLSLLAEKPHIPGGRFNEFLNSLDPPWETFLTETDAAVQAIQVSHRPTRAIAGPLHAETNYSKPHFLKEAPAPALTKSGKPAKVKPPEPVVKPG